MDIVLETKAENPSLALRVLKSFDDGSGYSTVLVIGFGSISADYDCFFEAHRLTEFVQALEKVDRTLVGSARLKPAYEDQCLRPFVSALRQASG